MDFPEFVQDVATRAQLSREEAADLSRACAELLGHLLSSGEARDLALELPTNWASTFAWAPSATSGSTSRRR